MAKFWRHFGTCMKVSCPVLTHAFKGRGVASLPPLDVQDWRLLVMPLDHAWKRHTTR